MNEFPPGSPAARIAAAAQAVEDAQRQAAEASADYAVAVATAQSNLARLQAELHP